MELQKFTRMGRARNESGKFIKMNNEPIKWNEKIFSRKKYDAELRAIIENVAKNVKDAP